MYDNLSQAQAASPANNFRGRNRGSYNNDELNGLLDRLRTTLDQRGRDDILVELERFITADVAIGHLYYQVRPAVVIAALKGVITFPFTANTWEWRLE